MDKAPQPSFSWIYEGIWGLLSGVMCVPRAAPHLPAMDREEIIARKPSTGFLRYLKFEWLVAMAFLFMIAGIVTAITVVIGVQEHVVFLLLAIPVWIAFIGTTLLGYLAIHLRYDTTWYVFSDRSMRLRRGVWLIRESTITYENIQNVKVSQGPLQRFFGIANVVVETAGGGSTSSGTEQGMHAGLIEGVPDAAGIRDSILAKARVANTSGLGDDRDEMSGKNTDKTAWPPAHLEILSEIRELSGQLIR